MTSVVAPGRLVVVGTPLGHRGDLSPRARSTILEADLLYCEDTRSVSRLFGAELGGTLPPRISCFAANEGSRVTALLSALEEGKTVAYISEAGMPCWSDPGTILVDAAVAAGFAVDVVPGPCAAVAAVAVSGISAKDSVFVGFPPRSGARRRRSLEQVATRSGASIMYEAGTRVPALLRDLLAVSTSMGSRRVLIARELTKLHQELLRGTLEQLRASVTGPLRGEVTLVIAGAVAGIVDGADVDTDDDNEPGHRSALDEGTANARAYDRIWSIIEDPETKARDKAKQLAELTGRDARTIYASLSELKR